MLFKRTDELKDGMRLARPIYSKDGVLLYERDSKLTDQSISSIRNFGMIGIFILEPAEPVPPMTKEDMEFERFQAMTVFSLREEMAAILQTGKTSKIQTIAANIISSYGKLSNKINFIQNLRSKEDYVYKHSLNVAILSAMISHNLNISLEEQLDTVLAAIVHDLCVLLKADNESDLDKVRKERLLFNQSMDIVERIFSARPAIKRTCAQKWTAIKAFEKKEDCKIKLTMPARILLVADVYDMMTAMRLDAAPASEVTALRTLISNTSAFDRDVTAALTNSIHILQPGTCVELNSGEKGLVISVNERDILRPMVIEFRDNTIIDLSDQSLYSDLEITDIMKTMDNRHVMKQDLLQ